MKPNKKEIRISDYLPQGPRAMEEVLIEEGKRIRREQEWEAKVRECLSRAVPIGRDWHNDAERETAIQKSIEWLVPAIDRAREKLKEAYRGQG